MATIRKNITVQEEIYKKFVSIAERKGIKFSTWLNLQLKNYVEEEEKKNWKALIRVFFLYFNICINLITNVNSFNSII